MGKGLEIPLNHPNWYPSQNFHNPFLTTNTMANLIDQTYCSRKPDLIQSLYPFLICSKILSTPIYKTDSVSDKLMWKFSNSGDYKANKAYKILLNDSDHPFTVHHRSNSVLSEAWKIICKVIVTPKYW